MSWYFWAFSISLQFCNQSSLLEFTDIKSVHCTWTIGGTLACFYIGWFFLGSANFFCIFKGASPFQPIQEKSNIFQPITAYSSLFLSISAYSIQFQPITAYSSLFQALFVNFWHIFPFVTFLSFVTFWHFFVFFVISSQFFLSFLALFRSS